MISEIAERRSIRKYKEKPVPQAMIKEIIQAGALAPSSKKPAALEIHGRDRERKGRNVGSVPARSGTRTDLPLCFRRAQGTWAAQRTPWRLCGRLLP